MAASPPRYPDSKPRVRSHRAATCQIERALWMTLAPGATLLRYSPKCVEEAFSEVRLYRVLRTSD